METSDFLQFFAVVLWLCIPYSVSTFRGVLIDAWASRLYDILQPLSYCVERSFDTETIQSLWSLPLLSEFSISLKIWGGGYVHGLTALSLWNPT